MKPRFQADADLNHRIVVSAREREPGIEFFSANEAGLEGMPDAALLEFCATRDLILVSHDNRTMPVHFRERLLGRRHTPGVLLVSQHAPLAPVVESLLLIWLASGPDDWANRIHFLPSLGELILR